MEGPVAGGRGVDYPTTHVLVVVGADVQLVVRVRCTANGQGPLRASVDREKDKRRDHESGQCLDPLSQHIATPFHSPVK